MTTIPESHASLLTDNQIVNLSTIGRDGAPQTTALWFLYEDGTLRMSINEARQKLKNLRRDPRASALFVDPANPYRTLELRGTVEIEADPDYETAGKVGAKYSADLRQMDQPGEQRSTVTFVVEKFSSFG